MKPWLAILALSGTMLFWAGVAAQQDVLPTPGFGSGMTKVTGTVEIGNVPDVAAAQRGDWRVSVTSAPPLVVATPDFARPGGRYAITWAAGDPETVTIVAPGQGGWVQVEPAGNGGKRRWVNLAVARAIQEER